MKKIEAIIRKTKFEDVKDALLEADIEWFSYYDVRGIGKARIIRKSKFPPNPERSVQFSGKRTKRSVQKKGCTQHL